MKEGWHDPTVTRTGLARSLVGKRTRATHHIAWKPHNGRDGHDCEDDARIWKRLILRRKAPELACGQAERDSGQDGRSRMVLHRSRYQINGKKTPFLFCVLASDFIMSRATQSCRTCESSFHLTVRSGFSKLLESCEDTASAHVTIHLLSLTNHVRAWLLKPTSQTLTTIKIQRLQLN